MYVTLTHVVSLYSHGFDQYQSITKRLGPLLLFFCYSLSLLSVLSCFDISVCNPVPLSLISDDKSPLPRALAA